MRTTRHLVAFVLAVVTMCVMSAARGDIHAQQQASAPPVMVGVAGTADIGGAFEGTFLLTRFDALANNSGLVAVGSVDGFLNGRNIITKVAIPVTVIPSSALQTAAVTGPTSCDTVHIRLEPSAFRALGAVVTLARSGLDITAPQANTSSDVVSPSSVAPPPTASATAPPTTSPIAPPATSAIGTVTAFPTSDTTSTASGSAVPTAPVGSVTPGVISPAPQPKNPSIGTSLQQLGQLLCSVSGMSRSSAPPTQLANALNQVVLVLQQ